MESMYEQICSWENLRLAHRKAARGKRGKPAAANFEYHLADELLALQAELADKSYRPGPYHSFYIHDSKHRLISAAESLAAPGSVTRPGKYRIGPAPGAIPLSRARQLITQAAARR